MHIDLFLDENCLESCAYIYLIDLEILLPREYDCQLNTAQASRWGIHSLVVDAFNLVNSSTDWPGLDPLHIVCSTVHDLVYLTTLESISSFRELHAISNDMMLTKCIKVFFHRCIPCLIERRFSCKTWDPRCHPHDCQGLQLQCRWESY